ncbi:wax ester/triacylglycerol synthase domain-containing protein [Embleya sp. NPDC055664]
MTLTPSFRAHGLDRMFLGWEERDPGRSDVSGIAHFEGAPPRVEDLRAWLAGFVDVLPGLTCRLVGSSRRARWVHDHHFDLDRHVVEVEVARDTPLEAVAARVLDRPLERDRPDWDLSLIHGYKPGCYSLCYRVHHCCQDGGAASHTLRTVLTGAAPTGTSRPAPLPGRVVRAAALMGRLLGEIAATSVVGASAATPLSGRRRLLYAHVDTARLRRVAQPLGGGPNEAHLAALTGMLHRWSAASGVRLRRPALFLAVDARRPDDLPSWGNRVLALRLPLLGASGSPRERLVDLIARGAAARSRRAAAQDLVRWLPGRLCGWLLGRQLHPRHVIGGSTTLVFTAGAGFDPKFVAFHPALPPGHLFVAALLVHGTSAQLCLVVDEALPLGERMADFYLQSLAHLEAPTPPVIPTQPPRAEPSRS